MKYLILFCMLLVGCKETKPLKYALFINNHVIVCNKINTYYSVRLSDCIVADTGDKMADINAPANYIEVPPSELQ